MIRAVTEDREVLSIAVAGGDAEEIGGAGGNAPTGTDRALPGDGVLNIELGFDPDGLLIPFPTLSSGLNLLWNAVKLAKGLAEDAWQFSIEWPELRRAGLTCNDARWLIHRGLVLPAREVTSATDGRRKFEPYASLGLSDATCLLLTEKGCRLARRMAEARGTPAADAGGKPPAPAPGDEAGGEIWNLLKPLWDRDRRELRLGQRVVKEFKVPAANQEIILAVFQEEDWPEKIDDPLPRSPEIDPQRRLHDTINSLNRNQRQRLVHFGADGLGRGVRWRLGEPASPGECC
jgi:hypothetical protein